MAIEKQYLDMIEEIKQSDTLSEFEQKFINGDADSSPIDQRPSLSFKQKGLIDRIYKERVQGTDREAMTEVSFNNDRVRADKMETNAFRVSIDKEQVGPEVSQSEAVGIVGWLSEAIEAIKPAAAQEGFPGE